jgi:hypothetical protein
MATRRWLGKALGIYQEDQLTVTGVPAITETITLKIGERDVVLTIGSLVTTTQVATSLKEMINGTTLTDTAASVSPRDPSTGDPATQDIGEFAEISASSSGAVVTVYANTRGKSFTLSVAETMAAGGVTHDTAGSGSSVACTGPNFFNNADNWSGTTVPVDSDDIVYDAGDVDCTEGLANSAISPNSLTITATYTGRIGRPFTNEDNSAKPYTEYRDRDLQLGNSVDAVTCDCYIGIGPGVGSSRINLDFGTGQFNAYVHQTSSREVVGVPACLLKGTHNNNAVHVYRGDVGIGFYADDTSTIQTLRVGYVDVPATDALCYCGSGVSFYNPSTIRQYGGTLQTNNDGTQTCIVYAGRMDIFAGSWTSIVVGGTSDLDGTLNYLSTGTLATLEIRDAGVVDLGARNLAKTVTTTNMYKGSALYDRLEVATFTNNIAIKECGLEDVILKIGTDVTVSRA